MSLVPKGRATIQDIGLLSDVTCKGLATRCKAAVKLDGILSKLPRERQTYRIRTRVIGTGKKRRVVRIREKLALPQPKLMVKLRSPQGRITRKTFPSARPAQRAAAAEGPRGAGARRPSCGHPTTPSSTRPAPTLVYKGRTEQIDRKKIGLRSVKVVRGELRLNNRPINIRGGSIHEDMPGRGAALTGFDMDTIVRELKEAGANTTRAHYLMNEALLSRLRQGRDHGLEPGPDLAARPRRQPARSTPPSGAGRWRRWSARSRAPATTRR